MESDQQHVILLRFLTATSGSHFAHQSHCHGIVTLYGEGSRNQAGTGSDVIEMLILQYREQNSK